MLDLVLILLMFVLIFTIGSSIVIKERFKDNGIKISYLFSVFATLYVAKIIFSTWYKNRHEFSYKILLFAYLNFTAHAMTLVTMVTVMLEKGMISAAEPRKPKMKTLIENINGAFFKEKISNLVFA